MRISIIIGLVGALLVGASTNLWQLEHIPPGLHADEAMIGYTTLSLLQTGKDLLGQTNFLALSDPNAGGTYPPLRSYILMPFVSLMGLSIFINRLPPALFGIIAIFLVFRICQHVFKDDRVALAAAYSMALNPWANHISRQGLLESEALTLVLAGIVFFFEGAKKPLLYVLSGCMFALSLFAYDAPRLFLPLFIIVLVWFRWSDVKRALPHVAIGGSIFALFFGLFLFQLLFRGEVNEYTRSGIFSSPSVVDAVIRGRTLTDAPPWASSLVHNKVTEGIKTALTHYVSIFSLNWFYVNGYGNLQEAVGNHGQYYLFELPLFFLGWHYLFRKSIKIAWFLLGWMLLGALPGGLSNGNYAYRSMLMLPVPILVSSFGLLSLSVYFKKMKTVVRVGAGIAAAVIVLVGVGAYLFTYFFDYPVYAEENWAKQQNDAIRFAVSHKDEYQYVFIDGGLSWTATYGFLNSVDTAQYQQNIKRPVVIGDGEYMKFGNIFFRNLTDEIRLLPTAGDYFPKGSLIITIGPDDVFSRDIPFEKFLAPGGSHAVYKAIEVR
ncbi:glycosyltransferase family 39 protein [Patescibacteria group bacterium]|nr:glycosyltransferase family 39 protein [Patescibacteria group bacterium]